MELTTYSKRLINECDEELSAIIKYVPLYQRQKYIPYLLNFIMKKLQENRKRISRACQGFPDIDIEEKLVCEKELYRYFNYVSHMSRIGD